MQVTIDPFKRDQHCVYIQRQDGGIFYVGMTTVGSLFRFSDAWHNSHWRENVSPEVHTNVIDYGSRRYCERLRDDCIAKLKPVANVQGSTNIGPNRIRCIETGQIFHTISKAADHFRADPSNLTKHLNGIGSFRTIRGYTFERIS